MFGKQMKKQETQDSLGFGFALEAGKPKDIK